MINMIEIKQYPEHLNNFSNNIISLIKFADTEELIAKYIDDDYLIYFYLYEFIAKYNWNYSNKNPHSKLLIEIKDFFIKNKCDLYYKHNDSNNWSEQINIDNEIYNKTYKKFIKKFDKYIIAVSI